ncbi:MAG: RES family NAD+ phosphorylase [Pseudomonadota bacterium]
MTERQFCWRISNERFANLSGLGGKHAANRWNLIDNLIVYAAEHPALAAFEAIATRKYEGLDETIDDNVLLKIDISAVSNSLEIAPVFPRENYTECQEYGTDWLQEQRTALMKVASVRVPFSMNILINPLHPQAANLPFEVHPFSFF